MKVRAPLHFNHAETAPSGCLDPFQMAKSRYVNPILLDNLKYCFPPAEINRFFIQTKCRLGYDFLLDNSFILNGLL